MIWYNGIIGITCCLVVEHELVNWDDEIPHGKIEHVPKHQPVWIGLTGKYPQEPLLLPLKYRVFLIGCSQDLIPGQQGCVFKLDTNHKLQ